MALPWWQHHKHCLGYYYYYYRHKLQISVAILLSWRRNATSLHNGAVLLFVCLFVRSSVCRQRVLLLAHLLTARYWATRTASVPDVSSPVKETWPVKREIYSSGGGLLHGGADRRATLVAVCTGTSLLRRKLRTWRKANLLTSLIRNKNSDTRNIAQCLYVINHWLLRILHCA